MIHTEVIPGKLNPQMAKVPKYQKKSDGKRRELSNVLKGMSSLSLSSSIYGAISTISILVGRPWSTVKSFLDRYDKRGSTVTSHDPVGLKSLANETNERSYGPYEITDSIHASKFVGSMPPMFPPHHHHHHRSLAPSAQYKDVASEEAAKVKGGTRKDSASMGSCTQGLDCRGLPAGDLQ